MFKNVAGQKIAVFAFDTTTGAPKTGDGANITVYVAKDWGAVTVLTDTTATELDATNAKGWYLFDVSQTESNADALLFSGKSATANISVVGQLIYTLPPNLSALSVDSNGRVDVIKLAGTTQTARDLGASVLLSPGTGTGQVSLSSGAVTVGTNNDKTGYALSTAGVQAIWDALSTALTTVGSIGKRLVDYLTGDIYARLGAPAGASVSADIASIKTDTGTTIPGRLPAALTADGNIKADTLRVGGTLQTAGDLAAMITTVDDYVDTEVAAILVDTGTDIPAQIAALNNVSTAQVNAEVVDALNVDTYAQPGQGAPAATTTIRQMVSYLYKWSRNKRDNDGTKTQFYNDDALTVDHKQTTSESAGTVTVGEMATGP